MNIWHRVTFSKRDAIDAELEILRIRYKKTPGLHGHYLLTFEIPESDPRWARVAELIRQKGSKSFVNTIFTNEEILNAEWVRLTPNFEQGYPQPEETWVTNPINYANYCRQCGTFEQETSFRLKREPTLGKNDFMTLYWTYAVFCTPTVPSELRVHQIHGYELWDAIIHGTNQPSKKVSQLFVPHVAGPGLVRVDDLRRVTCPLCGVTKYFPHMRGVMYLKRKAITPGLDMMQTHEWFGDGHSAYREVLISNRVAHLIVENGWRGVRLKSVELI